MCKCFTNINKRLAEYNGTLEFNMLAKTPRAMLVITKIKKGKKPPLMEATFCPFCGKKYPREGGLLKPGAKR